MRGCVVALAEQHREQPGGKIQIIDICSRKQRRVTRSTFAAELQLLVDSVETGKILCYALAEILATEPLAATALTRMEETGSFPLQLEACIDAKSVYDALALAETRAPTEVSLIMVLLGLKEMLHSGCLTALWWISTEDMLADGLNKGCVSRRALLDATATGQWLLQHPLAVHRELSRVHIPARLG